MRSPCCLCVFVAPLLAVECLDQFLCNLVTTPISTAYLTNPSQQSVCLYMYSPTVAKQQVGKNVTVALNRHIKIEELFHTYISMRAMLYQRKVGD
jgi:hypothetical protein